MRTCTQISGRGAGYPREDNHTCKPDKPYAEFNMSELSYCKKLYFYFQVDITKLLQTYKATAKTEELLKIQKFISDYVG